MNTIPTRRGASALIINPGGGADGALVAPELHHVRVADITDERFNTRILDVQQVAVGQRRFYVAAARGTPLDDVLSALIDAHPDTIRAIELPHPPDGSAVLS